MAIEKDDQIKMPKEILPEEVELHAQDMNPDSDIDVQMMEDGGAVVDFDPQASAMQGAMQHNSNLAEFLDDKQIIYTRLKYFFNKRLLDYSKNLKFL